MRYQRRSRGAFRGLNTTSISLLDQRANWLTWANEQCAVPCRDLSIPRITSHAYNPLHRGCNFLLSHRKNVSTDCGLDNVNCWICFIIIRWMENIFIIPSLLIIFIYLEIFYKEWAYEFCVEGVFEDLNAVVVR